MPEISADKVQRAGENSHAEYFSVGVVSVTWMAKWSLYACLRCKSNECAHTRAVEKFVYAEGDHG